VLTPEQESSLVSQGDCHEHYHSSDRVVTHEDGMQLIANEKSVFLANGSHVIPEGTDYVIADSTSGNVTLALPNPSSKQIVTVIKKVAGNSVIINAPSGLINGASSYTLSSAYQTARFKAISGNYYKVA